MNAHDLRSLKYGLAKLGLMAALAFVLGTLVWICVSLLALWKLANG